LSPDIAAPFSSVISFPFLLVPQQGGRILA
jgi:hypothetical protein